MKLSSAALAFGLIASAFVFSAPARAWSNGYNYNNYAADPACGRFFHSYGRAYRSCESRGYRTVMWATPANPVPVYGCDCPSRDWGCLPTNPTCID
jgi:hypothetical protein